MMYHPRIALGLNGHSHKQNKETVFFDPTFDSMRFCTLPLN